MDSLRGRQEDAQEFLGFLLDGIHEELLKSIDKPSPVDSQPEVEGEWTQVIMLPNLQIGKKNKQIASQTTSIDSTQITRIFGGSWRSSLRSGGKESVTTEPFQIITLEISVGSTLTFREMKSSLSKTALIQSVDQKSSKVIPAQQQSILYSNHVRLSLFYF